MDLKSYSPVELTPEVIAAVTDKLAIDGKRAKSINRHKRRRDDFSKFLKRAGKDKQSFVDEYNSKRARERGLERLDQYASSIRLRATKANAVTA